MGANSKTRDTIHEPISISKYNKILEISDRLWLRISNIEEKETTILLYYS